MGQTTSSENEILRNLASVLQEHREQAPQKTGTPVTDHHILKAMLGKRWGESEAPPVPIRKAG